MSARDFIKKLVREGISQTEIARKCSISNGTITKILYSESELRLDTLKKIAAAYSIPIATFLSDVNGDFRTAERPDTASFTGTIDKVHQTIAEQIGDGYSPEVKLMADYLEVKVRGKTREERLAMIEEMMAEIRDKYK
jgi:transcriptional regulator with XRE-family HTH domain